SDSLEVFVYVRRGGIIGRANEIPRYCDLNSVVARISTGARTDGSAILAQQTQVGAESMVGASTQLRERCSVKRSVVGAHCNIGKDVKIVNSVIMDHVTIGDGVKLESVAVPDDSSFKNTPVTEDSDLLDDGMNTEFSQAASIGLGARMCARVIQPVGTIRTLTTTMPMRVNGSSDSDLLHTLRDEADYEAKQAAEEGEPEFIQAFMNKTGFKIKTKTGEQKVTMTKQFGSETITISFDVGEILNAENPIADFETYRENDSGD
ncbi:Mitochondrial acidic protein mam33, partial [Coemansia sp. RSA 560]